MSNIRFFALVFLSAISLNIHAQTFQLNGTAVQISPRTYRLTDSIQNQAGSIFSTTPINLNNAFDVSFFINVGCIDYFGADGLAFLFQNSSSGASALGGNGIGMGFTNGNPITPSLAIEFDTYDNTTDGGLPDAAYDHIDIIKNGDQSVNQAGPVQMSATQWNVEDCSCHTGRIQWTPSLNRLRIYYDGALRMTYINNIIANYFGGNANVYWGFTGGTGYWYNIQTISIDFANAGTNLSVCRGSGVQLNGTGGSGVLGYSWSPTTGLSNA
ncbi:MAG: L-type lectin-domain containing protein, partial [Bacteroidota bacterium]